MSHSPANAPHALKTKRRFWTSEEETYLMEGVQKFGEGNWKETLQNYPFQNRTNMDLKDKWHNINKTEVHLVSLL